MRCSLALAALVLPWPHSLGIAGARGRYVSMWGRSRATASHEVIALKGCGMLRCVAAMSACARLGHALGNFYGVSIRGGWAATCAGRPAFRRISAPRGTSVQAILSLGRRASGAAGGRSACARVEVRVVGTPLARPGPRFAGRGRARTPGSSVLAKPSRHRCKGSFMARSGPVCLSHERVRCARPHEQPLRGRRSWVL